MNKKSSRATTIEDLPYEIMLKIFMSLNIFDLVAGASQVCTSWRQTARDPGLWNRVGLIKIGSRFGNTRLNGYVWSTEEGSFVIMSILRSALNLGGASTRTLVFNMYMLLTSDDLVYVAERSPNLRRLILPIAAVRQLGGTGFEEAVKHWKDLESMTLPGNYCPVDMVRSIGTHCKNFAELRIMYPLEFDFANTFVVHVPQLKVLSLLHTRISRRALVHLLKGMKRLETLDLSASTLVDDYAIYVDGIDLYNPSLVKDEIYPLTSALKKFGPWQRIMYRQLVGVVDNEELLQLREVFL